ncbi:MAG: TatD family hydrolase [Bacteroidales bacterium]|jgi:TatD DNase family protein|nr:TatD family hydrolase [Bacteroidales bacterium]HOI31643.1 TatD family hydrolase [Bacteroidales bacterium]
MLSAKYIDVHTHQNHTTDQSIIAIQNAESSFISSISSSLYYSYGIHPWRILDGHIDEKLNHLYTLASQNQIVAIGECGLDKAIDTPFEVQQQVFQQQINLSKTFKLPLIIHCVRAYSEILALRKKFPEGCWIIHGFEGNETLAKQLISKNMHLSIGSALFNPKSKISRSIEHISILRLFFETDDRNIYSIQEIYEQASKLLGLNSDDLKVQIFRNFVACFQMQINDP